MRSPTHWIARRRARAACFWLLASTLIFLVGSPGDRGLKWPALETSGCALTASSTPIPASDLDALQIIEPDAWRRTTRAKPDGQAKAAIELAALSDAIIARRGSASPVDEFNRVTPSRRHAFLSRAPPRPLAAA